MHTANNDAVRDANHVAGPSDAAGAADSCFVPSSGKTRKRKRAHCADATSVSQQGKHGVKPRCGGSCKRKCSSKISHEIRECINHEFWTMSHFQRRSFMLHSMKCKLAARKTVGSDSRRKHSYWYFLSGSDGETLVCKTFYLTTLGFERSNDKSLMNALKSTAIDSNTPGRDGRRRAPSAKKIDQSTVTAHIKTFNPAVSHYRREHAPHR